MGRLSSTWPRPGVAAEASTWALRAWTTLPLRHTGKVKTETGNEGHVKTESGNGDSQEDSGGAAGRDRHIGGSVRDNGEKSHSPALKKVRFSDQIEIRDEGKSDNVQCTASSSSSPRKSSSSSSSEPQLSIYEKWKRRVLRTNPTLFAKRQTLQSSRSQPQGEDVSRKRKHEALESPQVSAENDNEKSNEEVEEDDDDDSEDEPMTKYSKKGDVWLEENSRTASKRQGNCFDKVLSEEDHQNDSIQSKGSQQTDGGETGSTCDASPLRENGQCGDSGAGDGLVSGEGQGNQGKTESFNESEDGSVLNSMDSEDTQANERTATSLPSSDSQSHTNIPSSASGENINQHHPASSSLSSSSSPLHQSQTTSSSAACSSETSPSTLEDSSPSSASVSAPSVAAQKKGFKLSGLTTQLALAMAQKRQQKSVVDGGAGASTSDGEEDAESPPLLLPVGHEDVGRGGSREPSPCDDDMPVLVPDQLPPSLVEPGQDNIFQRMMSPEKHKV
ncbi:hypothetical protein EGW08_007879 [Elysia chlorotica]|uniref:Uncharacterized protein n=1 Tax=Elysia chlorotica TaxID=188477 RepID=A0A433TS18_ELYCH|nr:hypothetical protein EGW08_007879 [Elysia chlorotica]